MKIDWVGCHKENFRVGRRQKPSLVVIHVMDGTLVGTDAYFNQSPAERTAAARKAFLDSLKPASVKMADWKPSLEQIARSLKISIGPSSADFGIGFPWKQKELAIHQYVKEGDTSFHAGSVVTGKPDFAGYRPGIGTNDYSIGIEHAGTASSPWQEAMYQMSAELIAYLSDKYRFPIDRGHVVGHNEVWNLKPCPGKCDLNYLVQLARKVAYGSGNPTRNPA